MIIIYTLIAALVLFVLSLLALVRKVYYENKKNLKQIDHDHNQNVNETVLLADRLSEEEMAVFYSEFPFFDCYKSRN